VAELNAKLKVLEDDYKQAMDAKDAAIAEAAKCERKMGLA